MSVGAYLYMHVNFLKDIKEAVNYGNLWKTKKQEDQGIHFMNILSEL